MNARRGLMAAMEGAISTSLFIRNAKKDATRFSEKKKTHLL